LHCHIAKSHFDYHYHPLLSSHYGGVARLSTYNKSGTDFLLLSNQHFEHFSVKIDLDGKYGKCRLCHNLIFLQQSSKLLSMIASFLTFYTGMFHLFFFFFFHKKKTSVWMCMADVFEKFAEVTTRDFTYTILLFLQSLVTTLYRK
jgi:hypothetical protein